MPPARLPAPPASLPPGAVLGPAASTGAGGRTAAEAASSLVWAARPAEGTGLEAFRPGFRSVGDNQAAARLQQRLTELEDPLLAPDLQRRRRRHARLKRRLTEGLRLVQVREKHLDRDALAAFARRVVALAKPFGAAVLINGDAALAAEVGADGVHLTSAQVATLSVRPAQAWVGASCHTAGDLRAAEKLGVDFAVLGPVLATPTHPDAQPMDWEGFESLAKGALIPVYALGGVTCAMLDEARLRGAHGIAMLRGSWAEARR